MPQTQHDENTPPNTSYFHQKPPTIPSRMFGNLAELNLHPSLQTSKPQLPAQGDNGLLTLPASRSVPDSPMLSPPPETQLEEQRRSKALQLSANNNKRPRPAHTNSGPGSPTPLGTPNPRLKKHLRHQHAPPGSPTPNHSKHRQHILHNRSASGESLASPDRLSRPDTLDAYLSHSRVKGRQASRSPSPTPSRARSRTPAVAYSPPREQFTPPRIVMSPAPSRPMTSARKIKVKQESVPPPPSRSKKQTRLSFPPPDLETIDLTMPLRPPSPSEDPILLKGRGRAKASKSRLNHSAPAQKQGFNVANNAQSFGVQESSPNLFGADDTFAGRPHRGNRLSFKDLNQNDPDEDEIQNPDWILSDPAVPNQNEMEVEAELPQEQEDGSTTIADPADDWAMQEPGCYFDVQMDRGFGSDDDDHNDEPVARQGNVDRSEIVPSSDAEEEAEIEEERRSVTATSPSKTPRTSTVATPTHSSSSKEKEAPAYDEDDYEVPLAGEPDADVSLRELRPGSPHPNKDGPSYVAQIEDQDEDEEEEDGPWETNVVGQGVVRRRTLSEMEDYIDTSRRKSRSPAAVRGSLSSRDDEPDVSLGITERSPLKARTLNEMEDMITEKRRSAGAPILDTNASSKANVEQSAGHLVGSTYTSTAVPSPSTSPKASQHPQEVELDIEPPHSPRMDVSVYFEETAAPEPRLQDAIQEARARRDSASSLRQFNMKDYQSPRTLTTDRTLPFLDLNSLASPKPTTATSVTPQTLLRKSSNLSLPPVVPSPEEEEIAAKEKENAEITVSSEETPDEEDGIEVDTEGLVKISSRDPWAAARAAAILKQHHDYEEDIYRSRVHARRRASQSPLHTQKSAVRIRSGGVSKASSPSVLANIRSPSMLRELLHEAEVSVSGGSPRAESVFSERTNSSVIAPSLLSVPSQAEYMPVPGEWRKSDWKVLDRCFSDERLAQGRNGVMCDADQVEPEAVIERYLNEVGDIIHSLGSEWSTVKLMRRVQALKERQRAGRGAPPTPNTLRQMDPAYQVPWFTPTPLRGLSNQHSNGSIPGTPIGRVLSFNNIPETPTSTPTLPPSLQAPQYNHLKGEAGFSFSKPLVNIDRRRFEAPRVNVVPPSTPAPESSPPRQHSVTVSPTRSVSSSISVMSTPSGGVKGRVLSYMGPFFSRQHDLMTPRTVRQVTRIPGPSSLPQPSETEDIGAIFPRGPVSTPPRPQIPHAVAPKELVSLNQTEGPAPSKVPVFKRPKTPKRLVELTHIQPPPGTLPRVKRKVSTGSVRDIVRAFEEKDRSGSSLRKSWGSGGDINPPGKLNSNRLRPTSSLGNLRAAANSYSNAIASSSRPSTPVDPTTRPRWRL